MKFHQLTNPLLTSTQLVQFQQRHQQRGSSHDTYTPTPTPTPSESEFATSLLTQSAGVLCRLPQEVIATALVLLQRHWVVEAGTHSHNNDEDVDESKRYHYSKRMISAATLYLAAKLSFTPVSPRSVINVYAYLMAGSGNKALWFVVRVDGNSTAAATTTTTTAADPKDYYVSEGTYERERAMLFDAETYILSTLAFDTHVALPHGLALTYLQALGVHQSLSSTKAEVLSRRVFAHLNSCPLSPQMVCLTHQPNALAVAAIYLAAREVQVKLPELNWWEIFDVEREDLGFLVLAMGSFAAFAIDQKERTNV